MSNSNSQMSPASRAMIAGVLVGGTASGIKNWQEYCQGEKTFNQTLNKVMSDAVKAGLVSGTTMAVANATAGRPVLTLFTLLSAGAAGLYLLDSIKRGNDEKVK